MIFECQFCGALFYNAAKRADHEYDCEEYDVHDYDDPGEDIF